MSSGVPDRVDPAAAALFETVLDSAESGQPQFLLLVGGPREASEVLADITDHARVARSGHIIEVGPPESGRYDPVAAAVDAWKRGARRVSIDESHGRIAIEWLGVVPVIGDLASAVIETVRALLRRRKPVIRDVDFRYLIRMAQRRTLLIVLNDLHAIDAAAANRLAAGVAAMPPRARLLIVGGVIAAPQGQAQPVIVDVASRIPIERARTHRLVHRGGALDTLRGISPDALEAVQAASILGETFDGAAVAHILQIDELAAEDRIAIAVRAGLVHHAGTIDLPDNDIATAYRFDSTAVRDAALTSIAPPAREDFTRRRDACLRAREHAR
jgi:hypothetical protein